MNAPIDVFDSDEWWDPDGFLVGLRELLNPVRMPYILRNLTRFNARRVLDVGCGGGFVAADLVEAGFQTFGVDPNLPSIVEATNHGVIGTIGSGQRLPYADGSFDAAVVSEVLEHVDDPDAVVREVTRVLAPGGVAIITGPNRTVRSRLALIWLAQDWPTRVLPVGLHEHRRFIRPSELMMLGEPLGLTSVDLTGVGLPLRAISTAAIAYWRLRIGQITYAQAARQVTLAERPSAGIAYMLTMRLE